MSATNADHDSTDTESSIAAFLAEHPRMMGVVFTALLILTQMGSATAEAAGFISGP